jgi:hypothetical protein
VPAHLDVFGKGCVFLASRSLANSTRSSLLTDWRDHGSGLVLVLLGPDDPESDDDDIEIGGTTQLFKCPLTLLPFEDAVSRYVPLRRLASMDTVARPGKPD